MPKIHAHTYFKLYFTYTDSNSSTSNYGSTSTQCLVLIKLALTKVIVCYKVQDFMTRGIFITNLVNLTKIKYKKW